MDTGTVGCAGVPKGNANGAYKHVRFTCEAIAMRRAISFLRRDAHEAIQVID